MKFRIGAAALMFAGLAHADVCEVAADPALDAAPQHDVVSIAMGTDGETLTVALTLTELLAPTVDTDYRVHWISDFGMGNYVGIWLTAGNSAEAEVETEFGVWNPGTNAHDYIDFDTIPYSIDGSTITLSLPLSRLLEPTSLGMIGAQSDLWASGFDQVLDATANDGNFDLTVGCGESDEATPASESRAAQIPPVGSAGATGLVWLFAGLLALGRRRCGQRRQGFSQA